MTVQVLIDLLSAMDPDAQVRIAMQPLWPYEYTVDHVVTLPTDEGGASRTVYLAGCASADVLPAGAAATAEALGWR